MNNNYAYIRSLAQLQKEQALLKRRIKLSEKLLQKDYDQFKSSFSFTRLITSAVKGVAKISTATHFVKTGFSLLSLLLRKHQK